MIFFSRLTLGIHDDAREDSIPADAMEISAQQRVEIITAIADGKMVDLVDGEVVVSDRPAAALSVEQVERQRLFAYAEPVTGSDRYFAEAQRESLLGNAGAADTAKALGMARFAEIQAEYPWPAE